MIGLSSNQSTQRQAPQELRNRTRASRGFRFAAASAVLVLLSGIAISSLNHRARNERLDEITIAHIESYSYDLRLIEEIGLAKGRITPAMRADQSVVDRLQGQVLSELIGSDDNPQQVRDIERALSAYTRAANHEYALIDSGQRAESEAYARDQTTPGFCALIAALKVAAGQRHSYADRASDMADLGTGVVLAIAAAIMVFLIVSFGRAQQVAANLTAEQDALERSKRRLDALVYSSADVEAIVRPDATIVFLSSAAPRLWGYEPAALEGSSFLDFIHPDEHNQLQVLLTQVAAKPSCSLHTELRVSRPDGSWRATDVAMTNLLDDPGIEGIVLNCRDISERKAFEQQLAHQAFHDALTGLPNRALFMERVRHALEGLKRDPGMAGVIFFDLDNFKVINDSLGHEAGDILLKAIAGRLSQCVRGGNTVARLGGDEFTVLIENVSDDAQIFAVAESISAALQEPLEVGLRQVFTTGSLGVAISRGEYESPDDLLRDADTAMYQAKTTGKGKYVVFHPSMNARAVERLELESDMREALATEQFRVYYQPILTLETGEIRGAEALVRWAHPTRGLIEPARFIPLAEETGLIVHLGLWVLEQACRQMKAWNAWYSHDRPLTISVNLSGRQLQQDDLVEQVKLVLLKTGLPGHCLKLEITESTMMQDAEAIIPKLHELKDIGVMLAVDDFGTGYSSMAYLSSLPIDTLKVDRSFVSKIGNQEDGAIVDAIVTLAKTLNLTVTSEGVETSEQLDQLTNLGCDDGQGYLFARPMPHNELEEMLRSQLPSTIEIVPKAAPALGESRQEPKRKAA